MITPRLVRGVDLTRTVWWLVLTTVVLTFVLAEPAVAAATVTRAEVSGT